MRFSTLLLQEALTHQWFYLSALFAGVILWYVTRPGSVGLRVGGILPVWTAPVLLLIMGALLFINGYLLPAGFYTPYSPGTQGDNFYLISSALRYPRLMLVRHLFFPWAGAQLVFALGKAGVIATGGHDYLLTAFRVMTIPVKIASLCGLIFCYRLGRSFCLTRTQAGSATAVLAASFAYWLWSIQPNALAIAMALQTVALFYAVTLIRSGSARAHLLAAIATAAIPFVHLSGAYFVAAMGAGISAYCLSRIVRKEPGAWQAAAAFIIPFVLLSSAFVLVTAGYWGFEHFSIRSYIENMGDKNCFGSFILPSPAGLIRAAVTNVAMSVTVLSGIWLPQTRFDHLILWCLVGLLAATLMYLCASFGRMLRTPAAVARRIAVFVFLPALMIPFAGFLIRNNGSHYYAITLVPQIFFLFMLLWRADALTRTGTGKQFLAALAVVLVLYNGSSTNTVLKGLHPGESFWFTRFETIDRTFPDTPVTFIEPFEAWTTGARTIDGTTRYFFEYPLAVDYAMGGFWHFLSPAYPRITWEAVPDLTKLTDIVTERAQTIVLGPRAFAALAPTMAALATPLPGIDGKDTLYLFIKRNGT